MKEMLIGALIMYVVCGVVYLIAEEYNEEIFGWTFLWYMIIPLAIFRWSKRKIKDLKQEIRVRKDNPEFFVKLKEKGINPRKVNTSFFEALPNNEKKEFLDMLKPEYQVNARYNWNYIEQAGNMTNEEWRETIRAKYKG